MKFNWGTGIFSFLALFLIASGVFIFFATRQEINLVHSDYYEKGVDHMEQIRVEERSAPYKDAISTSQDADMFIARFSEDLYYQIDSGELYFYRPSDSHLDLKVRIEAKQKGIQVPLEDLSQGRYILKLYWFTGEVKYEIDHTVIIE